ncbi:hypothetical protein LSH36_3g10073 [Paralvinella palmiformis]|uniref:Uncharacterized protein n=1 Tax=Paralvinella palmiformis TaxID=53620 RepID=A0AAD9NJ85_9ANNE|nr:hypothetical protein LSH36_3g10073 [Paralvinella palmiformis]
MAVRVELHEKGKNKLIFQNHHKQFLAPFTIYADFETLATKVEGREFDITKSNTQKTRQHEASNCYYVISRSDDQTQPPVEYRGPNPTEYSERPVKSKSTPKPSGQASYLTVPSRYNSRQLSHPLCLTLAWHLLDVMVPKQPVCQGQVKLSVISWSQWTSTRPRLTEIS